VGAISAAYEAGLKIPDDVSITGCEDLEVAASVPPGLTTVRYPTTQMGHFAGVRLLDRLKGGPAQPNLVFPTELIIRGTTARSRIPASLPEPG
jgi:DNA-binding LacI/PurR family transcriptional regulator